MKKYHLIPLLLLIMTGLPVAVQAKKTHYLYRNRANWVKLEQLSSKQLAGERLKHPHTEITTDKMTEMLQSLAMNKAQLLKKGFKTAEVFSATEARKYAPLIVKALRQAAPNEVVNVAVVHKRPYFIVRNDFISVVNIFATDQGFHFNFTKLFAKLQGDYKQASRIDRAIHKAKSIRVSLVGQPGQTLLPEVDEVIMDPLHDFAHDVAARNMEVADEVVSPSDAPPSPPPVPVQTAGVAEKQSESKTNLDTGPETTEPAYTLAQDRLKTLEGLREAKLISKKEYKKKRAEILGGL